MSKKLGTIIFSCTVIVLSLIAIWLTTKFRPVYMPFDVGPRVFPILTCIVMILLSVIIIIKELYSGSSEKLNMINLKTILCFGVLAAYVFLMPILGFILNSLWVLAVTMLMMGARKLLTIILFPICFTAAFYLIFSWLLHVPLPLGVLSLILY